MVAPITSRRSVALEEVRWASIDASLSELTTIIGPECTAFVMTVNAAGPWILNIDLGREWRLTQVVLCPRSARDSANALKARIEQDLIDDRFQKTEIPASSVTLEVTQ
jgi:hypothetical protein